MASEPVTMQQSYDERIMTSWQALMSSVQTAIGTAGTFPMPTFFPYQTYHGTEAAATTQDLIEDLLGIDYRTEVDAHWDQAFHMTTDPYMMDKEQVLYDEFLEQNELSPAEIQAAVEAFVGQQEQVSDSKVLPALQLKFIANNCVFSSLYVQAQTELQRQILADADKLGADLTVQQKDRAATRTLDLLKTVFGVHANTRLQRSDLALRRMASQLQLGLERARLGLQANMNASADRFNLVKAQYQINIDDHRWPLDNLKYLISAQSAMQGIHTLQQSQSGADALSGFSRIAYDAGNGINLGAQIGNLALGVYNAWPKK